MLAQTIELLISMKEAARKAHICALSAAVHLAKRHLFAVPRQLSNCLKQRGAIAGAFASDPQMLICHEPTSALDGSVQTAILSLLAELQATKDVSYILISHDIRVVRCLSDRIAVMYL